MSIFWSAARSRSLSLLLPPRHHLNACLGGFLATVTMVSAQTYPPAALASDIGQSVQPTFLEAQPGGFIELGEFVYFFGNDGVHGQELWRTDLTEEGTEMVKDLCSGVCHGMAQGAPMVSDGGRLYFFGDDGAFGAELWTSQGTAATTQRLLDLRAGPKGSSCGQLLELAGNVFFVADDGQHGCELWATDGTAGGTVRLTDAVAGPSDGLSTWDRDLFPLDNLLLFWSGDVLWRSDGTPIGTQPITTIPVNNFATYINPSRGPKAFDGRLYFSGWDVVHGWELWATDGTAPGTELVADLRPGVEGSYPEIFVEHEAVFWFGATDQDAVMRVWRTDGSAVGTSFIPAVSSYYGPLGGTPQGIVFARWEQSTSDYRLTVSDGNAVTDLVVLDEIFYTFFEPRLQLPNGLFLGMSADSLGPEPWITEGTPGTTFQIKDIYPGSGGSVGYPVWSLPLQLDGGDILFQAFSTDFDASPWITDGTALGTHRIRQVDDQTSSVFPGNNFLYVLQSALGRRCLTTASEGATGTHGWWSSAGTPSSTVLLPPSVPMGSRVDGISSFHLPKTRDRAILGVDQDDVVHLWGTDGTFAGTEEISTAFGPIDLDGARFVPLSQSILIDVADSVWQSDGTLLGTTLLPTLIDALDGASTEGTSYLSVGDAATGVELWRQDHGQPPVPIADLEPGAASSNPSWLVTDPEVDRGVFFFATTAATGREPWYSDGTPSGTQLLGDLFAGADSSRTSPPNPSGAQGVFLGSTLLFAADDGVHGNELWISDGTPGSASLLVDLYPEGPGSEPAWLTRIGNVVYFVATTPNEGRE
ncbi:MAG: hypothetical protein K8J08_01655, partial [Thermoanaerobaculia bacterium]|nr:hypothetical protein [Thermoanaerobaculia bacterium]